MGLRNITLAICSIGIGLVVTPMAVGQNAPSTVLFENVRIFNGSDSALSEPSHVLVKGNKIERISASPIPVDRRADTKIIKGGGRTLMPGLIDAHVHTMMESISLQQGLSSEVSYMALVASKAAEKQLLRGFTSVRDAGGPSFALKRAIDEGVIIGPRIYPSGAPISQTSGHGDYRSITELPRVRGSSGTYFDQIGMTAIADGFLRSMEKRNATGSLVDLTSANWVPLWTTTKSLGAGLVVPMLPVRPLTSAASGTRQTQARFPSLFQMLSNSCSEGLPVFLTIKGDMVALDVVGNG